MTWCYSIIKSDKDMYNLGEVYHDKDGKPNGWFIMKDVYADTPTELIVTLRRMLDDAMLRPIIDDTDYRE